MHSVFCEITMARDVIVRDVGCLALNILSSCAIVFANKIVFEVVRFQFAVALTAIHTIATLLAAQLLSRAGLIVPKRLPRRAVIALAGAFTGYIVLSNISLAANTVGFYQLTKIAIAPTILVMDSVQHRSVPPLSVTLCVVLVCVGIGMATVFDKAVVTNPIGLFVGFASVVVSAQYGMWIGGMTKQHGVSSMQLLEQYLPAASIMMSLCVPAEVMMLHRIDTNADTLLTFSYSYRAVGAIAISALLGVMVTFSTFSVIGNTSPLTYAVAGHVKTVVILGGGVVFFHDSLSPVKSCGILIAVIGVIAYSTVKLSATKKGQKT